MSDSVFLISLGPMTVRASDLTFINLFLYLFYRGIMDYSFRDREIFLAWVNVIVVQYDWVIFSTVHTRLLLKTICYKPPPFLTLGFEISRPSRFIFLVPIPLILFLLLFIFVRHESL